MKKMKIGMFGRIVLAILGGMALGFLLMHAGTGGTVGLRILKTFNVLFAQVLKFIVPLLILGLVTPAIADAGKGAGKLLVTVMILSYLSTCAASLFGYVAAGQLLPHYVAKGAIASAGKGVDGFHGAGSMGYDPIDRELLITSCLVVVDPSVCRLRVRLHFG